MKVIVYPDYGFEHLVMDSALIIKAVLDEKMVTDFSITTRGEFLTAIIEKHLSDRNLHALPFSNVFEMADLYLADFVNERHSKDIIFAWPVKPIPDALMTMDACFRVSVVDGKIAIFKRKRGKVEETQATMEP